MNSKKTDDKLSGRRQLTVPQKKLERNSTILNIYPQNVQRTTAINNNEAEKPNDLSKKTVRRTHRKESPHRPVAVTKTKENVQNSDFESFFNSAMTLCEKLLIKQEHYFDDDDAELKENEAPSKVPPPTDFTTKEQLPIRCSTRLAHRRHEQGQNRKNLKPIRSSNEFEDCEIKRELIEFSEQENCLDYNEIPSKMPPTFSTMELSVKESPADGFTTKQLPLKEPILCLTRLEDTNLWPQQEWSHKELKTNDDRNQSSNEFEDIYNIETEPTQLSESLTMKQNRKNCKTALKKTRSSNDFEDDCNIKTGVSQRDLQQSTSTVPSEIETANLTTISSHSGNQEQSGLGDPPGVIEYEVLIKAEPEDSNDEAASTAHSSGHEDSEAVTGYIFMKVPVEGDTDGRPTMCWVEPTGNLSLNEIEKMAENLFNTEVGGVSFANWSDEHITDSAFSINRLEDASIASGPVLELQIEHLTSSAPSINGLEDASIASDPVPELQIEHLTNSAPSINGLEDASIASDPVLELQIEHLMNSAPINGLEDASIATCSAVKSAASTIQVDETESKEDIIHGEIWELMEDLGFVEEDIKMEDDVEDLFSVLDCGGTDTGKTVEERDINTGEDIKMEDDVEDLFSGLDCDDIDTAETVEERDIITGDDIKMEDDVEDLFSGLDCDDIDTGETVEEVDIEMKDIEMEDDKDLFSLWDYADIDTGESVEEQEIKIRFSPLPEQSSETEQNRHLVVSPGYGIQEEQEIATFERSRGQRVKELQDEQQPGFTSTPVQTVARRSRSRLRSSRRAKSAAKKRALSDSFENHERKVAKANKASMPLNISEGRASQSRYITRSRSRCSEQSYQPVVAEEDDKEVDVFLSSVSESRVAQSLAEDEAPRYCITRSKSRCSKEAEQSMTVEENSKEVDLSISEGRVARSLTKDEARRHIIERKSRSREKAHYSLAVEEDDEEVKELLSGISTNKVAQLLVKEETSRYVTRSKSRCSEQTYQPFVVEEDDKEVEILLSGISKDRVAQSLFEDEAPHYYVTRSKSRCSKEAEQPMVAEKNCKELDRRRHITKRKSRSGEKAHHPLAVEEDDEEVKELMSGICEGRVAQSLNKDEAPHKYITRSKSRCSKEAEPPILAKEDSKDAGKPLSISEHRVARSLTKDEAPRHITKRKSRKRNRAHQPVAVGKDDKEVKELLSGISESRVAQSLDEDKAPRYHITRSRSRCSKEAQPPIATKENSKDVGKPSSISEGRIAGSLTKDETRRHIIESKSRSREEAHQSLAGEEADKEVEELLSSFSESRVGQSLDKDEAPRYYITRSKSRCSKEAEQPIAAQEHFKVVEKPVRIFEDEASCHITKRKSRSRKGAHQPVATEDVDEEIRILLDGISESRLAHSLEDEASHCYITRSKSRCREEAQQLVTPQGSDKAENVLTSISEGRVARSLTKDVAPRYITRSKSRCRAEAQQPIASEESARDVRLPRLGKVKNLQEDVKYFSDDTDVKKRLFYKVFIDEYYKQIELKKRILNNFSNKHSKSANKENTTNLLKDGLFSCLSDNTAIIGKDLTSQPEALNKILRNELPIVSTAKATVSENTKLQVTEIDKTSTISVTNQGGSKKPVMGEPRDLLKCNMCVDQTAVQSNLEDHKAFVHYGKPLVLKQNATEIRNKSTSLQNWGTYTTSCNHNKIKKQLMHVQSDNKRHFEVGEAFSKCSICHQSQDSSQLLKFNGMNVKGATNSTYAPDVCPLKIPNSKTCTETNFMKDEDTAQTKFKDSLLIQCNNEVNSTGARNFQNLRVDDTFENKYQGKRAIGKFNSFHKQKPYSKQGSSENELTGSLLVRSRTETTSTSATNIQNIQNLSCRPCSDQNIEEKNNESVSFIKSRDSPEKKTRTTATGLKESIKNRLKVYTLTKEQLYGTPGMLKEVILKDFDKTSNSPPKHIRPTYCKTENLETKAFHKEKIHITNAARSLQVPKTNVTGQSERSTERISKTTLGETANVSQPAKRSLDCASQPALDQGINAGFVQASKAASARYNSALQRRGTFKRSFSASEIDNLKMVGGNNNFYPRILTKADYTKNAKATGECEMQMEIEKMYCIKQALKCIQLDHSYAQDTSGPYQILEPLFFGCNQCSFSAVLANSLQDHMITFHNKVYQAL